MKAKEFVEQLKQYRALDTQQNRYLPYLRRKLDSCREKDLASWPTSAGSTITDENFDEERGIEQIKKLKALTEKQADEIAELEKAIEAFVND